MLTRLTKALGVNAAIMVAALYAFAVLVPHAALAFAGPNGPVHCLIEVQASHEHSLGANVHVHADGTVHSHDKKNTPPDSDESKGSAASCCGLFATVGMMNDTRIILPTSVGAPNLMAFFVGDFAGQGPGRIIRPPIA
jgi:hypothetical protein